MIDFSAFRRHCVLALRDEAGDLRALMVISPCMDKVNIVWPKDGEKILFKDCVEAQMSINEAKLWLAIQKTKPGLDPPPRASGMSERVKRIISVNGVKP